VVLDLTHFLLSSSSSETMATNEIPIPRDPTDDEALALFGAVEEKFPTKTLGVDKWYILLVCSPLISPRDIANNSQFAAMVGGGQPGFAPLLYKELIKRPEYQTSEQRQALMRRIRETLFKLIVIVGVCKPLEAIFDIDAATRPEDKDYTFSRYECAMYQTCSKNPNNDVERAGSAMRRTRNVVLHGWIGSIRTTCRASTMCWHRREISVGDCPY
jgi:hypothetical protein